MKKILIALVSLSVLAGSCKKFDEINTDPAAPQEANPAYLLTSAMQKASNALYDGNYNGKLGMQYAQYWTQASPTTEARFQVNVDGLWPILYSGALMDLQEITNYYDRTPSERNGSMIAASRILKDWIFHNLTDMYVDIPYSEALQLIQFPKPRFDRAQDVYASLLDDLTQQIATLSEENAEVITGDLIARGSKERWIKFANALKLRIALRMSDAMPQEAAAVIVDAAQNTFTSIDDDMFFPYNNSQLANRFPYNDNDRELFEMGMSATIIDYMVSVSDPRLPVYARPSKNADAFVGKPYGTAENTPALDDIATPGVAPYSASMRGYMITYSEVEFILAEAAARGIAVAGTAEEHYENAIRASVAQWNDMDANPAKITDAAVDDYLLQVPYTAGEWKNVIGTQKWLALYMQGFQGWAERLRLDFKKPDGSDLFIPPVSGSLDPNVTDVPKRLAYPTNERNTNGANVNEAAARIGGDHKGIRNWWDIN